MPAEPAGNADGEVQRERHGRRLHGRRPPHHPSPMRVCLPQQHVVSLSHLLLLPIPWRLPHSGPLSAIQLDGSGRGGTVVPERWTRVRPLSENVRLMTESK